MRRLRLATFLTVPALALGACGGSDAGTATIDGMSPMQMLSAASARAEDAGSARVEATMAFSIQGQDMTMSIDGAQDLRTGTARMTMDLGDMLAASGQPLPDGIDPTMEMLVTGTVMYARGGIYQMMGVDGWIRMDLQAIGEEAGMDLGAMMGSSTPQDFSTYLDMLRGASDDIEELGREDVRGVSTQHFRATVDQARMTAEMDAEAQAALLETLEQTGFPASYPMDVWIGDDGLVRRISMEVSGLDPATSGFEGMSMTFDFFDFGVEVDVTPPAESVDFMELLGGFGG